MSTEKRLQKIEEGDQVTVIDEETGLSAMGETYSEALEELVVSLREIREANTALQTLTELQTAIDQIEDNIQDMEDEMLAAVRTLSEIELPSENEQVAAEFIAMTHETHKRFENKDVDEETVEEAIEWARSE